MPDAALSGTCRGWKRWAAIGDLHCPFQDERMVGLTIDVLREWKPDVAVLIGDVFEALAASRWPSDAGHKLSDEYRAAADVIGRLRASCPRTRWVFCEGNHDANIMAKGRIEADVKDLVDYRVHLAKALRGVLNVPYVNGHAGRFRLGPVTFTHGFDTTAHGGRNDAIRLGAPGGLLVEGHTHRPLPVTQARINDRLLLPYWYANTGTLSSLKPDYTTRANTDRWGSGIVVGSAKMGRAVQTTSGGKMGRGWTWEAETIVFRTSDPDIIDQRTGTFREREAATGDVLAFVAGR